MGPSEQRWRARPVAAHAVQLAVLAVPIAASVGCAALVSNALPRARHLGPALGWWAVVLVSSTVVMYAVDRVARRLLPLALLLRLSLVFPDQAPQRFRIAARAWNSRRVREQLAHESTTDATTSPIDAAAYIIGLLASLATHDRRTRGHCERVRAYNDLLAEELGLSDSDRDRLRWAALIHDIGKLKVSRRLLNKPGKPTEREWQELHAHPARGAEIAAPLNEWLGSWSLAIAQHHEHWDGTGYPLGLAGADISLGARIVGVADAFEVMTSPRPYSKAMSAAAARKELASCAGTHFDPQVVRALLNISLGRLRRSMGPIAWFAQVPLLAAMPRLSAVLIQSGQAAAIGTAGAVGVVAVSAVPAASTHVLHHAAHHHPASIVAQTPGATDPLAAALTLTGQHATPSPPAPAQQAVRRNGKARGLSPSRVNAPGQGLHAQITLPTTANGQAKGHATATVTATRNRLHGTARKSTSHKGATHKSTSHKSATPHGSVHAVSKANTRALGHGGPVDLTPPRGHL